MNFIELKTHIRTTVGNGPARALRREGRVPAVLYGPGKETVLLSVSNNDLEQILKKSKTGQLILNLVIQNGATQNRSAMIKELQIHPVTRNFLHVDFYEVAMDREIKVKVPVSIKGKSKGVEEGGVLQIVRRELEVACLPGRVPRSIEIDISELEVGDSIHVQDIHLEGDVESLDDPHFTVVTILSPKMEVEEAEDVEEIEEGEEDLAEKDSAAPEAGEDE